MGSTARARCCVGTAIAPVGDAAGHPLMLMERPSVSSLGLSGASVGGGGGRRGEGAQDVRDEGAEVGGVGHTEVEGHPVVERAVQQVECDVEVGVRVQLAGCPGLGEAAA